MRPLSIVLTILLSLAAVAQNGPCTETAIKTLSEKHDADSTWSDDAYFFSAALEMPLVGRTAIDHSSKTIAAGRKNEKRDDHSDRIVVDPSGDMAYEYGTFHLVFDDKEGHEDFIGAFIRVWKADSGQCKIAALMAQPEGKR